MEPYDFQFLTEIKMQESEQAARDWDRVQTAKPPRSNYDPYTLRWALTAFSRWRQNRVPKFIRKGGYGELYRGSFR